MPNSRWVGRTGQDKGTCDSLQSPQSGNFVEFDQSVAQRPIASQLDSFGFQIQFVRLARGGDAKTSIYSLNRLFVTSAIHPGFHAVRGENPIVFLTTDSTDFTDKIAG